MADWGSIEMVWSFGPASASGMVSVLQLTDLHLYAREGERLLGVDTARSFEAIVQTVVQQNFPYDLVIITGDISQDYSAASYTRFSQLIRPLQARIFFLPGNHDDGPLMYRMLGDYGISTERHVICGNWQFVFLNSEVYGVPHGWLCQEEQQFLQECVYQNPELHTVVCVHHMPLLCNSAWLDSQTMHNHEEFNACLTRLNFNNRIKLVMTGHIHQEFDRMYSNIRYIASPSTSIQFQPNSQTFALDYIGPGYRTFVFDPVGSLTTRVYRLPPGRFVPDSGVQGY